MVKEGGEKARDRVGIRKNERGWRRARWAFSKKKIS